MRCFEPYPVLPTATSRIAATGGTLPALRAGEIAATSVTPTPATSEMITVLAVRTIPPAGSSKPNAARSALSAAATRMPTTDSDHRGDQADGERLDEHRHEYLSLTWHRAHAAARSLVCVARR